MDDQFDEWEAYVSGGQPGGKDAARYMFVCVSTPDRRPRYVRDAGGDPAEAENKLHHMDEAGVMELFGDSAPID
jgi:hypothetical protein